MRRLLLIAIALLALASPANAAGEAPVVDDPDPPEEPDVPDTEIVLENTELVITAAEPGTLEIVETRNPTPTGRRVYCGWFDITSQTIDFDIYEVIVGEVGETYLFSCWYTGPWIDPLAGYPVAAEYPEPTDPPPGDVITASVAARHAIESISFEPPAVELSPAGEQVVGVPSWLAVTSELAYPEVTAEAGAVFATARPVFDNVTWNLGNGDQLACIADATTTWDPDAGDSQTSACSYTYQSSPDGDSFAGSATVTWNIWQITNETNGAEVFWGTVTLTTDLDIAVTELQAAIR
jgi:hypothetical protein